MKTKFLSRILATVLALTVLASLIPTGSLTAQAAESVDGTNWMSQIDGSLPLSSISIPGTHDSATQYITPAVFLQCQNTDFATQLDNGYRYLDIRLALETDKDGNATLKFIHNFGDCRTGKSWFSDDLVLEDCLDTLYSFLDENPTETVMFVVKCEDDGGDLALFEQTFFDTIDKNASYWYTENEIPELDDVRGKAVLATRFEDVNGLGEGKTGLHLSWSEQNNKEVTEDPYELDMINDTQSLWVEDRYKYNVETKFDAVSEVLDNCQADDNAFSICFCSTSGSGTLSNPKKYAASINANLMNYEFKSKTCYGVVVVDFASAELAQLIYNTNF